jgi:hypothetical protein
MTASIPVEGVPSLWDLTLELVLERRSDEFYVSLTVRPCIILYMKPTWCTVFLSMFMKGVTSRQALSNTLHFMTYALLILYYPLVSEGGLW